MYETAKTALGTVCNWGGVAVSILHKRMNDGIARMPVGIVVRRCNVDPGLISPLCIDRIEVN